MHFCSVLWLAMSLTVPFYTHDKTRRHAVETPHFTVTQSMKTCTVTLLESSIPWSRTNVWVNSLTASSCCMTLLFHIWPMQWEVPKCLAYSLELRPCNFLIFGPVVVASRLVAWARNNLVTSTQRLFIFFQLYRTSECNILRKEFAAHIEFARVRCRAERSAA